MISPVDKLSVWLKIVHEYEICSRFCTLATKGSQLKLRPLRALLAPRVRRHVQFPPKPPSPFR